MNLIKAIFVSLLFFIVATIFFFSSAFIHNSKLYFYLKKKNHSRWCELTTIGSFSPGGSNPFKWLPYIYNEVDNRDKVIKRYKDNVKIGLKYSFFFFLALLVNIAVLIVLLKQYLRH